MKKLKIIIMMMLLFLSYKLDIVHAENIYKEYKIGDKITYNGMDFYVIENSDTNSDSVTMLKAEPLTVDEVNKYGGVGTDNNHVNMYVTSDTTASYYQTAYNYNGYGGMVYYSSSTCGYNGTDWVYDGCTTDYEHSSVKYVVDAWATDKINISDLIEDKLGYKTRLLTFEDLTTNLGYTREDGASYMILNTENTPSWVYNSNYWYWTMSRYDNFASIVWYVYYDGDVSSGNVDSSYFVVRPVITIKKEPIVKIKKLTDKEFKIGDIVEYNNMLFYVIKNSTEKDNSVTMLKAEALTVDEVNKYGGVGTENNHVNMYVTLSTEASYYKKAYDWVGYGGMAYYSSPTCGYGEDRNRSEEGCMTDYNVSDIKYVVDAWADDKFSSGVLVEDAMGYRVRLLARQDLTNNLGYEKNDEGVLYPSTNGDTPSWVYTHNYWYWLMSPKIDSSTHVWAIGYDGSVYGYYICDGSTYGHGAVRPVVTMKKISEDNSEDNSENPTIEKEEDQDIKNEVTENNKHNQIVSVPDTLLKQPIIFIIIGVLLIAIGAIVFVIIKKKHKKLN